MSVFTCLQVRKLACAFLRFMLQRKHTHPSVYNHITGNPKLSRVALGIYGRRIILSRAKKIVSNQV